MRLMPLMIVLLGTPSISWCQEPHASATFQSVAGSGRPSWTVTIDSDGMKAVRPAEAGKHPEFHKGLRSAEWKECAFVDNRDGRYRRDIPWEETPPQLWVEIRWATPGSVGKTADTGEPVRFYPVPHVFRVDPNDSDAVNGFLEARKIVGERCVDTPLAPLPGFSQNRR